MSNLSDLMPAGASGKTIEAVATATITSKAPVILNSAGTVTQVGETVTAESLGSPVELVAATVKSYGQAVCYDSANDKLVAVYFLDSDADVYATVGTISGTSVSWATPVAVVASTTGDEEPQIVYDENSGKVVVFFSKQDSSSYLYGVVGTVSGTTTSWETPVAANSYSSRYISATYNSDDNTILVGYTYFSNSTRVIIGTVSGSTLSFAGDTEIAAGGNCEMMGIAYDTNASAFAALHKNNSNQTYVRCGTISGSTITLGTDTQIEYDNPSGVGDCSYDSTAQKVVFCYRDANDTYGYGRVGTISGTAITFGTATAFNSSNVSTNRVSMNCAYSGTAGNTTTILYIESDNYVRYINGTVSGTGISFNTAARLYSDNASSYRNDITHVSAGKMAWTFMSSTTVGSLVDNYAYGGILQNTANVTNLTATNFVGIADAGIATSATGTVVVQGGSVSMVADTTFTVTVAGSKFVIDGVSQDTLNLYEGSTYKFDQAEATNATHPLRLSAVSDGTHGSPAAQVFTSESSLDTPCITYDTTNDKIVIAYRYWSGSANVGAVIVGTVSGNSITYGTPVDMPTSAVPTYTSITYDSNANRVVISYRDADNSDYGTSVVVTISGTTPSFGTPVVFESANSPYISSTYDSDNNKVVIAYQDVGNSSYGTAIVGTVSGTSISFGTAVPFVSANTEYIGCTFDSSNNKTVIAYKKNDGTGYGTGIVGTVSGTSISFGTEATFQSNPSNEIYATFDSTANKTVFAYQLGDGSDYGNSVVGTVSGTGISFGSAATFNSASTNNMGLAYDATADTTTIAFKQAATTGYGTKLEGTVAGTGISFGSQVVFESATTSQCHLVYDPDQAKIVISYLATTGKTIVYPVSEYTTGVTTNGTPGSAGAYTQIVVASGAPTLYYYCSSHSGYGGTANTPSYDIGSNYYVQNDGTITTVSSSVKAGLATSTTQLLLNGDS